MNLRTLLRIILESLNPTVYKGLTNRKLHTLFAYFFSIAFVYIIILGLINIPSYYKTYHAIDIGKLEKFSVNVDIETKEPIILSQDPKIIFDTQENRTYQNENFLITSDTIYKDVIIGVKNISIRNIDLLKNKNNFKRNSLIFLLIILPIILILSYLFVLAKYLLIALFLSSIGLILMIVTKQRSKFSDIFKISVYPLTIFFISNIITSIYKIPFLGFILYIIMFIFALILYTEETFEFLPKSR